MSAPRHLFIIAGEPSGDRLGASLMAALKTLEPGIRFSGIGGALMTAEGLQSRFDMDELSVMGIFEVLPKLRGLLARVRETADAVVAEKPDALITIDSPDFCLRVAKKAREEMPDLKTIHYVAPTVWAWRPERAVKMARHIDHVLALFPFEPAYMKAEGMSCDFVGHPVVAEKTPEPEEVAAFRMELGLLPEQPLLVVLPGSRRGEIARMEPVFAETIEKVTSQRPDVAVIVPAAVNVTDDVAERLKNWPGKPILLDPRETSAANGEWRKRLAFAAADLALAASGTVSLELASTGTPMVIAYRFNWLTTRIVKKRVKVKSATLVNLLTDTIAVPEFLFERCRSELIAPLVIDLLGNQAARQKQQEAGTAAMKLLGRGGEAPGMQAARSVLSAL